MAMLNNPRVNQMSCNLSIYQVAAQATLPPSPAKDLFLPP